jgi:hypoxanthine phosphoribosyltransferase
MRVKKTLITNEQIQQRVKELAEQLNKDYADIKEPLVLVGILKGSFIFLADLCRYLTIPHVVDFMAVSSYSHSSDATKASGNVRIIMDCRENQQDRDVLIVEDILDSGHTLDYLIKNFKSRYTKSVKTIVLVRKDTKLTYPVSIDYLGFEIPNVWVVGYGLDYAEKYRTLPYIAELGE